MNILYTNENIKLVYKPSQAPNFKLSKKINFKIDNKEIKALYDTSKNNLYILYQRFWKKIKTKNTEYLLQENFNCFTKNYLLKNGSIKNEL